MDDLHFQISMKLSLSFQHHHHHHHHSPSRCHHHHHHHHHRHNINNLDDRAQGERSDNRLRDTHTSQNSWLPKTSRSRVRILLNIIICYTRIIVYVIVLVWILHVYFVRSCFHFLSIVPLKSDDLVEQCSQCQNLN